jgi:predicted HicB family RNase H-like nuclease
MKNLNVRLPDELHALLQMAALDDNRSLNREIITLLSGALRQRDMTEALQAAKARSEGGTS